jgi:hypothetical protein
LPYVTPQAAARSILTAPTKLDSALDLKYGRDNMPTKGKPA